MLSATLSLATHVADTVLLRKMFPLMPLQLHHQNYHVTVYTENAALPLALPWQSFVMNASTCASIYTGC